MHEHPCSGDGCVTCERINELNTLAYNVRDELSKRPFHKRLKKKLGHRPHPEDDDY